MSTDINIKKRITILEESAILTKDVNSIDFVGTGVVSSAIGDDVTVTINGGVGTIGYFLNESVTQSPYKEFSSIVTTAIEQLVPLTVAGGVTSVIAEYQTPTGVPGTTQIAAGLWAFYLHFNAAIAGQNWVIRPTVLKRDLGGIETLLFTSDPAVVTNMATVTTMYTSDGVFPSTTLLTTDRIVVRISMENLTGVSQTVTFRTEGSQHYSVATTTLNPTYNPSAVLGVSGTAPIVSSGGTTPAISIPQATGSVNGYLSSSDFAVFNAKVPATRSITINGTTLDLSADRTWNVGTVTGSGTTNYLSKFTGTGTIGNSQTQDNGANIAVNGAIVSAYKFAVYSTTPGENYNIYGNTTVNGAVGVAGVNQGVGALTNYGASGTAQSSTALNIGVYGQASGASTINIGGKFVGSGATTNYSAQLQDGTEGVGKVLTSMTSDGKAQWATAAGGLTYFTEAQNSATPNATVKVDSLTAIASTTNADIAIVPKGTGAFTLAVADNLVAGGNKRGANSVDLQTSRSSAAQVASGANSILIGGYNNTASGIGSSVIGGYNNTGSGTYVTILGGYSNSNSGSYGITAGAELYNSGSYGACLFGWSNSTSGNSSFVSGYGNSNSGAYSGTIGSLNSTGSNYGFTAGTSNTNTSPTSLVFGASNSCLTGGNNIVLGTGGTTMSGNYGRFVFARLNTVVGDAQNTRMILSRRTTDATLTALTVDGAAPYFGTNEFKFQDNTCVRFKGTIVGKKTATTNVGVWDIDGVITRVNSVATTTIVVSNINVVTNASVWGTPTLTINGSYGNLSVNVTGVVATNIQWVSHIEFTEVVY